ncbi:MAG: DUF192 domain-containing protein [Candidatus Dojkabacteria bacterium]|nr:DUF192 domain-containing protein [Candidatus Dojkabacteria bacterium]
MENKSKQNPETKYKKWEKIFNYVFSPILLISLLILTFFYAQGLRYDGEEKKLTPIGNIRALDVNEAEIFINDEKYGDTTKIIESTKIDTDDPPIKINIKKKGRKTWEKYMKPKSGYMLNIYPILYPETANFSTISEARKFYPQKDNTNFLIYEKIIEDKIYLIKYSVIAQLIFSRQEEKLIANITDLILEKENELIKENKYNLFISNTGNYFVLHNLDKNKIYFINDNNIREIQNIVPANLSDIIWSPDDKYIVLKFANEIFTYDHAQNRSFVLYKSTFPTDIIFLGSDGLIISYKENNQPQKYFIELTYDGSKQNTLKENLFINQNTRKIYQIGKNYISELENKILYGDIEKNRVIKEFQFNDSKIFKIDSTNEILIIKQKEKLLFFDLKNEYNAEYSVEYSDLTLFNNSYSAFSFNGKSLNLFDSDGTNTYTYTLDKEIKSAHAIKNRDNVSFFIVQEKTISPSLDEILVIDSKKMNIYQLKKFDFKN